jgi:hypothetical protein
MGKKADTPAAPDFQALAASNSEAAHLQAKTSAEQLDWAKAQYADQAPATKAYMQSMTDSTNQQLANAQKDRARYESIYQPIESQFAQTAQGWNAPARANQQAAAAEADVGTQFEAQRKNALSSLESYGIDPSQTRFGALDLGTRVSQAAATAAAGTQSRRETEAMGLSLQGEAINIGKGYPGQVSQAYAGATQAGQAGINSGLNTSSTYGNLMGTANQWAATSNQALGMNTQLAGAQGQYGLGVIDANAKSSSATGQGIGMIAGAAIGAIAI